MNYQIERDVTYVPGSTHVRQQLDIYRPENATGEKLPTVVYFHGGGWEFGNKEKAVHRLEHFYDTGYILIAVGYRLIHDAIWPAQMDDVISALEFVQTKIPDVDTDKIGLWGASAGGHLACLLAGGCRAEKMPKVKCLVNYCGPMTLNHFVQQLEGEEREHSPVMKLIGGDHEKTEEFAEEASATNWIKPGFPPTLSAHGDKDTIVPIEQSEIITAAIQAVGSEAFLHLAEGYEHRLDNDELRDRVKAFFREQL